MMQRYRLLCGGIVSRTPEHRRGTVPLLSCRLIQRSLSATQVKCLSSYKGRIPYGNASFPAFSSSPSLQNDQLRRYQRYFSSKADGENSVENSQKEIKEEGSTDLGLPGAQKGGKKLAIVYTCTVCNTRAAKQFTEQAYRHGVVIVQCPGCNNRHLIADNLGFFEDETDGWNIEKAMAKLGENVKVVNDDNVLELSIEDVYGDDVVEKATRGNSAQNSVDHSENDGR
eukprot:scaffold1697_cov120-Cylindrotheca_fusiformis.AAC.30